MNDRLAAFDLPFTDHTPQWKPRQKLGTRLHRRWLKPATDRMLDPRNRTDSHVVMRCRRW
jgi:hypothetical protein